jgi:hypothetical protein
VFARFGILASSGSPDHQITKMAFGRPAPAKAAIKEMRSNLVMFGTVIVAARLSTYLAHLWQKGSA